MGVHLENHIFWIIQPLTFCIHIEPSGYSGENVQYTYGMKVGWPKELIFLLLGGLIPDGHLATDLQTIRQRLHSQGWTVVWEITHSDLVREAGL